ncbi:metallophosphoesterase [Mucilaginibacter pedocola]|uniref:Metallophosphoesterase n=1 Tax=Mucilaginibacter pedocola TaxID=1792845 RepID=A0A1S9PIK0_9SPHI|nr:metallophosphoesterase [Mucilaginibacter pedocola]OOQ60775.1 metallophosphoesterase [Mucilaginibacter pedocola]
MQRTFVIGDIHGCYDELIALTEQVGLTDEDKLISLGDIVDRGNKSKEVYEYFRNRPNSIVLIGNHERKHINGILTYAQDIVKLQFGPDYEGFVKWLNTLNYFYETGDAIIVHAAFENGKALAEQKQEVLCGSTAGDRYLEKLYGADMYWNDHYTGSKPIIYGHHVVGDHPLLKNNTYGIDTGACHGGYLTAIELPGFIIHQVKAKEDYWKSERAIWQKAVLQAKDWHNMEFEAIDKLLAKLSHVNDGEAAAFLTNLKNSVTQLQALLPQIKIEIDAFTSKLANEHGDDFNAVASVYSFKTFIFKSRANNLKPEDLVKSLNTPQKIIEVAVQLELTTPILQT